MADQQNSGAKPDSFIKAFLPGLVLGVVIGAVAGATLPTMLSQRPGPVGEARHPTGAQRNAERDGIPVDPRPESPTDEDAADPTDDENGDR
ncbi:MAG: hypothetical protein KF866_09125 [Phycisphaeraceae bacterium]|nr:hypothetical protein [Phycisphaeraceae bacterium]